MITSPDQRLENFAAGPGPGGDWLVEGVRAVIAKHVIGAVDIVDARAIKELATGQMQVETVVDRSARVL